MLLSKPSEDQSKKFSSKTLVTDFQNGSSKMRRVMKILNFHSHFLISATIVQSFRWVI